MSDAIVVSAAAGVVWAAPMARDELLVIGRDLGCDIVIRNPGVARRHATLTFDGARYVVRDLGSGSGLVLGGLRVEAATIPEAGLELLVSVPLSFRRLPLATAVARCLDESDLPLMPLACRLTDEIDPGSAGALFRRVLDSSPHSAHQLASNLRHPHAAQFLAALTGTASPIATLAAHAIDGTPRGTDKLRRLVTAFEAIVGPPTDPHQETTLRERLRRDPACLEVALLLSGLVPGKPGQRMRALIDPA